MARFFHVQQVSEVLFRSPQPDFDDLVAMKARGLKAVVNLREEAVESEFFARQCGLAYLHLSVLDWTAPEEHQVRTFLEFLQQTSTVPALVHCQAGVGRTGTFVACYRVALGMPVEQAIRLSNQESPLPGFLMNAEQERFIRQFRP